MVKDAAPLIAGCVVIGDAWAVTDPLFGWGASLAMAQGFDLASEPVTRTDAEIDRAALPCSTCPTRCGPMRT